MSQVFAIEDIILPLFYEASNPEHVEFMEVMREKLLNFLTASGFAPKRQESSKPNTYRENLFANFAKKLISEGLLDGRGKAVSYYDACDYVSWLYHGYKWLNAQVCEKYDSSKSGKCEPVMGFTKTVVDGVTIINHGTFGVPVPSEHTNVNWSAWSGPQMIDPLKLRLSTHAASHKKSLYHFFEHSVVEPSKNLNSPEPSVLKNVKHAKPRATLSDHIAVAMSGGGAGGSK